MRRIHPLDAVPERPTRRSNPQQHSHIDAEHPPFPILVEHRLVPLDNDRTEPLQSTKVMNTVHHTSFSPHATDTSSKNPNTERVHWVLWPSVIVTTRSQ